MAYYPKQRGTTEQLFSIGAGHAKYSFTLDASTMSAARTWKLPDSNGSTGQVLSTDGLGNLFWATSGSGGTDFTVPYYLTSTETFNVAVNRQALFAEDIVVDGTLNVDGHLIDTRAPDATIPYLDADGTGTPANAFGSQSIALGYSAAAAGLKSIAIGEYATASAESSVTVGDNSSSDDTYSTVIGTQTLVSGTRNTSIGAYNQSLAPYATMVGNGIQAYGNDCISLGSYSIANAPYSTTITSYANGSPIPGSVTSGAFSKYIPGISATDFAKTVRGTVWCRTTDATTTKMAATVINATTLYPGVFQSNTMYLIRADIQGTDGTDLIAGNVVFAVKSDGGGALSLLFTQPTVEYYTSGATTWQFNGNADAVAYEIAFEVTGEAGKNISWCGSYTITQVTYA